MVVEYTVSPERTSTDNVAIGQYVATLCIYHETSCLTGHGELCIERAGLTEVNGDSTFHDLLNGSLPFRRVRCSGDGNWRGSFIYIPLDLVYGSVGRRCLIGSQDCGLGSELLVGMLGSIGRRAALSLCTHVAFAIHGEGI